jgi:hypothetical protein
MLSRSSAVVSSRTASRRTLDAGLLRPACLLGAPGPCPGPARVQHPARVRRHAAPSGDAPRGTTLDDLKAILLEQGAQLNAQGAQLNAQGAQLNAQGAQLNAQGAQLNAQGARLDSLDRRTSQLQAGSGCVLEMLTRTAVDSMFGGAYSRPLLARSLQDLALLWPPGQTAAAEPGAKLPPADEPVRCTLQLATAFAAALAARDIPRKLLLGLRLLVVVSGAGACLSCARTRACVRACARVRV